MVRRNVLSERLMKLKRKLKKNKQKCKSTEYSLKQLFTQPKPKKDFFDQKRTTNILNKLFDTFTKDEFR